MQVTTTHYGKQGAKAWAWSYSKLKNYETCPKRHWHVDVQRDVKEEESDELAFGNQLHKAMALRISKGQPLLPPFDKYEKWALKVLNGAGEIKVENKFAIRADFSPCSYFDNDVWYRGIGDVTNVLGSVGVTIDWKTGKIVEDSVQLALMAQCMFSHYPALEIVRTAFVWTKFDAETILDIRRDEMAGVWSGLMPRVNVLHQAYINNDFPAKPGFLCKRWCPVTKCPHNGE